MALQAGALRTGFAASLLLHLLVLATLLTLIRARPLSLPVETRIDVELLQAADISAAPAGNALPPADPVQSPFPPVENSFFQRTQPAPLSPVPEAEPRPDIKPAEPPPPINSGRMRATDMLSGKVLADPRSREALRQFKQLAPADRIEQICNLEAMQQVHHWKADFAPEFVVAYAASDPIRSARSIEARGAAFLSRSHWYAIDFLCIVTDDLQAVASFEFKVGREIPEDKWGEYSLFASSKAQD